MPRLQREAIEENITVDPLCGSAGFPHPFTLNVARSKKDDPGQIALDASLFDHCFSQIRGGVGGSFRPRRLSTVGLQVIHFPDFLLFGQPIYPF